VNDLQAAILHFLMDRPSRERIAHRSDLEGLGPAADIDAALGVLEAANRIGSPADGYWMPLERWEDRGGLVHYSPPTQLTYLLQTLVQRAGIQPLPSWGERSYQRWLETDGAEGVWGTPNYQHVGVSMPFPPGSAMADPPGLYRIPG